MANITGSPFPVSWIGSGPNANGQIVADLTSGPKSKTLVGVAKVKEDGSNTAFTLGFIDGVQKIAQYTIMLPAQSVAAPATINGTTNQVIVTVNSGPGQPNSVGQIAVGTSVTFAGFTNSGNNGSFTVNAVGPNFVQITNASGVAETNYAATLSYTSGAAVAAATLQEGNLLSDTSTGTLTAGGGLSSATNALVAGALSAAGTSGHIKTVLVTVYLAS